MHTTDFRRSAASALLGLALAVTPLSGALAQGHDFDRASLTGDRATDMAVDLVVARPLGLVSTVIGTAGFILALPFTIPTGTVDDTAREWIGDPLEYTFNRPLGDFDRCGSDRHACGHGR